jgi:Holliday junction resolvase
MALKISNRRLIDCTGPDHYPTPPWAVQALLSLVEFEGPILEPCAGSGDLAEALKAGGYQVAASDLLDFNYGEVRNFLSVTARQSNVVTNPPYNIAESLLLHALNITDGKVAFLLRTAFLESCRRYRSIFAKCPPTTLLVFSERLSMYPKGYDVKGGGTTSYAWFVWNIAAPIEPTRIVWIPPGLKPKSKRARSCWGVAMTGGKASRQKGDRAERGLVRLLQAAGFAAERIPLSGSVGGKFSGDVSVPLLGSDRKVEVKARANGFRRLYDWLDGADLLVVRADRSEPLVVLPLRFAIEIAAAAEKISKPSLRTAPTGAQLGSIERTESIEKQEL